MYQGTAHTSGLKMRVLRGVDGLHEVPGDVMQAWCRRNGMSHQRPPRLPFGLRGLEVFSPVIHRSRPGSGAISGVQNGPVEIYSQILSDAGKQSKQGTQHACSKNPNPSRGSVSPNGIQTHRRGYASQSTLKKRGPSRGTLPL